MIKAGSAARFQHFLLAGSLLLAASPIWSQLLYFLYQPEAQFSDLTISHLPNAMYLQRALREYGQFPFWSPAILSGYPFSSSPLSGALYPPNWLAVIFPTAWAFNLLVVSHLFFGGVGMFVFLVHRAGLRPEAGILAGAAFAGMPALHGHYAAGHFTLICAIAWLPWLFASRPDRTTSIQPNFFRALSRPAICLAVIFYADPRWAFYSALTWLVLDAGELRADRLRGLRHIRGTVIGLAQAAILTAPAALPLATLVGWSTRQNLAAQDVFQFSLPPAGLLGVFIPNFARMAEWVLYPGAVIIVVCLLGLVFSDLRRRSKVWWWLVAGSLLFALGDSVPFLDSLSLLPGFNLLRVPARALLLTDLAFIVLAAYTVDHVLRNYPMPLNRAGRLILVGLASVWLSLVLVALRSTRGLPDAEILLAGSIGVLAALLTLIAFYRPRLQTRILLTLFLLSIVDSGSVNFRFYQPRSEEQVFAEGAEAAAWLASQPGRFRIYSPSYSLPQHTGEQYRLEQTGGVEPLQLERYAVFFSLASGVPADGYSVSLPPYRGEVVSTNAAARPEVARLSLLNARYLLSDFDLHIPGLDYVDQMGPTRIYANPSAIGEAWIQVDRLLGQGDLAPVPIHWTPNRVEIQADGPGILVLSEIAYPEWRVTVDGRPSTPLQMEPFRAVELEAGSHQVVWEYQPRSLWIGLVLLVTFLVIVLRQREGSP